MINIYSKLKSKQKPKQKIIEQKDNKTEFNVNYLLELVKNLEQKVNLLEKLNQNNSNKISKLEYQISLLKRGNK
jgi:hypothetical protein